MNNMRIRSMALSATVLAVLTACGGGGGNAGTSPFDSGSGGGTSTGTGTGAGSSTGTTAVVGSVKLALSLSAATVTSSTPVTVRVLLTDVTTGAPLPSKIVQFSTANKMGAFSADSALTGSDGVATVTLSPAVGVNAGADEVVATTTVNGTTVTQREGFQLTASSVSVSSLTTTLGEVDRLSPYGQTNVAVALSGAASGTPVEVSLISACVSKGKASISPAKFTTTNGAVDAVYKDMGCGATDTTDTIQAVATGSNASKTTTVNLTPPTVNSVTFSKATPSIIYLKGSGLTESSTVVFKVVDTANNPLPNRSVDLKLETVAGGVSMDQGSTTVTKNSDAEGNVSVQINSGTVPTPVRVSAALSATPSIKTVSSGLTVAVGLPSEQNFSLSQTTINIEGFNIDATKNAYTVIASDRSGNPVPAQTAINFVTEGGQVEPSKEIVVGADGIARTSANFVSAGVRPTDGRVTVTAYALGEESFLDYNGNNVWDLAEPFQDLGDVYKDRLYDGVFASDSTDEYVSLGISASGACAVPGSPLLQASAGIPSRPGTCDGVWGRAYVRAAVETVLSTSSPSLLWPWGSTLPYAVSDDSCTTRNLQTSQDPASVAKFYRMQGTALYGMTSQGTLSVIVADANPVRVNPMAAGTTIDVKGTEGLTATMLGGSPVPNTAEATGASFSYKFDDSTTSGTITVTTTSPSQLKSSTTFGITMNAMTAAQCTK